MGGVGLVEWKSAANMDREGALSYELKEHCEIGMNIVRGEQGNQSEAGDGLILENEPQQFRDSQLETLNVERPEDDHLSQWRESAESIQGNLPPVDS